MEIDDDKDGTPLVAGAEKKVQSNFTNMEKKLGVCS